MTRRIAIVLLTILLMAEMPARVRATQPGARETAEPHTEVHTYFVAGEVNAPAVWVHNAGCNIDTGAAINFIAEGSTTRAAQRATVQAEGGRMIMSQTAVDEFLGIVSLRGGPREKARAARFLMRVDVVPNQLSTRAQGLVPHKRKLGQNDINVFGTGDFHGVKTMTTDDTAYWAMLRQNVRMDILRVYPGPIRLTGQ